MDALHAAATAIACLAVISIATRLAVAAPDAIRQMFRSPAELGWPAGVQEDDDFRWDWGRPGRPKDAADLAELPPGGGPRPVPVRVRRIRG